MKGLSSRRKNTKIFTPERTKQHVVLANLYDSHDTNNQTANKYYQPTYVWIVPPNTCRDAPSMAPHIVHNWAMITQTNRLQCQESGAPLLESRDAS